MHQKQPRNRRNQKRGNQIGQRSINQTIRICREERGIKIKVSNTCFQLGWKTTMWGQHVKKSTWHSKTEISTRKTAVVNMQPSTKTSGAVKIWKEQGERWGTCVNLVLAKQHTRGITKITELWRNTHSASVKRSVPVHKRTTTTYQKTIDSKMRHTVFVVVVVESFDFLVVAALSLHCRCHYLSLSVSFVWS